MGIACRAVLHQLPRHPHETIDGRTVRDHITDWKQLGFGYRTTKHAGRRLNFARAAALRMGAHRARNHLIGIESCGTRTALTVPRFVAKPSLARIYDLSRVDVVLSLSLCAGPGTML